MGLYYQPPLTYLGAQQPLTPKRRTPPQSGPAPQNPPLLAAASLAAVALSAWAAAAAPLPQINRTVAVFAAPPIQRPIAAPSLIVSLTAAWQPAAWPVPAQVRFIASGPMAQTPPIRLRSVPAEVLAWLPPVSDSRYWPRPSVAPPAASQVWWISNRGTVGSAASATIAAGLNPTYQTRLRSLYLVVSGSAAGLATAVVRDGLPGVGTIIFQAHLYVAADSWDFLDFNGIDLRATAGNVLTVEFVSGTSSDFQEVNAEGDFVAPGAGYSV